MSLTNGQLIACIEQALVTAKYGVSRLPNALLELDGMSGARYRHYLNKLFELLGATQQTTYLEVGSWKGSTLCAAIYGNNVHACSIDNFSEFNGVTLGGTSMYPESSKQLVASISHTLQWGPPSNVRVDALNQDCFTVDPAALPFKADVYFYDGEHSYASQYKAFTHFDKALADTCIIMVDDYEKELPNPPREATQQAFTDLGYKIIKDWYNKEGDSNKLADAKANWWNGVYIALINKTR